VFVAVECDRLPMASQIALGRGKVIERRLCASKPQFHELTRRVVHEHEQRASRSATFEPVVVATIDLHELADAITSSARRLWPPALLAS
jgi:hypothetical protein